MLTKKLFLIALLYGMLFPFRSSFAQGNLYNKLFTPSAKGINVVNELGFHHDFILMRGGLEVERVTLGPIEKHYFPVNPSNRRSLRQYSVRVEYSEEAFRRDVILIQLITEHKRKQRQSNEAILSAVDELFTGGVIMGIYDAFNLLWELARTGSLENFSASLLELMIEQELIDDAAQKLNMDTPAGRAAITFLYEVNKQSAGSEVVYANQATIAAMVRSTNGYREEFPAVRIFYRNPSLMIFPETGTQFGGVLTLNDDEADEWLIQYGNMTAYYGRLTARAYASDELKNGVRFFDLSLQAAQSNLFYKSGVDSTNEFGSGRAVANRSFGGGLRYGLEMGNGRTGLALGIGVGGLAIYEAEYLYGSLENIQDDVEQTSGYEFNRVAFTIDLYSSINFKYFILTGRALLATNQKGKEDRFGNTPQIGHGFWTFEAGVGIPLFRTYRWKNKR